MDQSFKSVYLNPHRNYTYVVEIHSSKNCTLQEFHQGALSIEDTMGLGTTRILNRVLEKWGKETRDRMDYSAGESE